MFWRFACLYVCLCEGIRFSELKLQTVESCHVVLGTEPTSSERAASSPNHRAISPAPEGIVFKGWLRLYYVDIAHLLYHPSDLVEVTLQHICSGRHFLEAVFSVLLDAHPDGFLDSVEVLFAISLRNLNRFSSRRTVVAAHRSCQESHTLVGTLVLGFDSSSVAEYKWHTSLLLGLHFLDLQGCLTYYHMPFRRLGNLWGVQCLFKLLFILIRLLTLC